MRSLEKNYNSISQMEEVTRLKGKEAIKEKNSKKTV